MSKSPFARRLESSGLVKEARSRRLLNRTTSTDLDIATQLFDILESLEDRLLLGRLYSSNIGTAYIPISGVRCEANSLARLQPQAARRLQCIPLYEVGLTVTFALVHPEEEEMQTQLQMATGRPVRLVFSFPQEIEASIERHYGETIKLEGAVGNQCHW